MDTDDDPNCTKEKAKFIKAVDKKTVHQICSGQVIVSLSTAAKELLENSLDAGAKKIEVRMVEYGAHSLEVSDDGSGIEPHNFEALTLKHHTSKIQDFSDLALVETFGFRGEALSSLCALSDVSVVTRHSSQKLATHLQFDVNGGISKQKKVARSVGTTVLLQNLFQNMPVRRKEFERNLKREFGKLVQVLQAYCLVSKGVRISCFNRMNKAEKLVMQTSGKDSLKDRVEDLFGQKQLEQTKEIVSTRPEKKDFEVANISAELTECPFQMEGLISNGTHGQGRGSTDRQFFFVNNRPCDNQKLSKLVNEIYHQFNKNQYPFVYLNITFPTDMVDVNLTPDKRQVLVQNEKLMIVWLRSSVNFTLSKAVSSFECNRSVFDDFRTAQPKGAEICRWNEEKISKLQDFALSDPDSLEAQLSLKSNCRRTTRTEEKERGIAENDELTLSSLKEFRNNLELPSSRNHLKTIKKRRASSNPIDIQPKIKNFISNFSAEKVVDGENNACPVMLKEENKQQPSPTNPDRVLKKVDSIIVVEEGNDRIGRRRYKEVAFNLDSLRQSLSKLSVNDETEQEKYRRFLAKISPSETKSAEAELSKNIEKEDFRKMKILGQFNLGFIIVQLVDDLFIVDQHATDEKYNFERLLKNTVLESQSMVVPQKLELTVTNQILLQDNLNVFQKNGFDFKFELNTAFLTKIPHFRNWTFTRDDVDELLFMLSENGPNDRLYRPSKVQSMFASRACRTSVMIGTALSSQEMRRLIDHMSEMEHPWNCPHGRPTLRHLANLHFVKGCLKK